MPDIDLKKKPLVEAIVEIRWKLETEKSGAQVDRGYPFLLGLFHEQVKERYPVHEELPSARIPDEMTPHIVQHRFRAEEDGWPLVQIGPGIFTVNQTETYLWSEFKRLAIAGVEDLCHTHPDSEELDVVNVVLKYIDAIPFDYEASNLLEFLRDKLKIQVALPDGLLEGTGVRAAPRVFNWLATFDFESLPGSATLKLATGRKQVGEGQERALIMETIVQSVRKQVPKLPDGFSDWLESAHKLTRDWFFKLIEGDLEKEFRGE